MNPITKLAQQNGLLNTLKVLNNIRASNYSRRYSRDDERFILDPDAELIDKLRSKEEEPKSTPIFYTGPRKELSICEQRRIKKCHEEEDEICGDVYCHKMAPECHLMPEKVIPGRVQPKYIPGRAVELDPNVKNPVKGDDDEENVQVPTKTDADVETPIKSEAASLTSKPTSAAGNEAQTKPVSESKCKFCSYFNWKSESEPEKVEPKQSNAETLEKLKKKHEELRRKMLRNKSFPRPMNFQTDRSSTKLNDAYSRRGGLYDEFRKTKEDKDNEKKNE